MVRRIAAASFLYQEGVVNRDLFSNAYMALEGFLTGYAYERNVSVKNYSVLAKMTLKKVFDNEIKDISIDDAKRAWQTYHVIAAQKFPNLKLNCSHNPMNSDNGVLQQMAEKKIIHLSNFLMNKIHEDKTQQAHNFLIGIRGIGPKIAPFYLRDLVFLSGIEESKVTDSYLLQPIDRWLKCALSVLLEDEKLNSLTKKQKSIVKLCSEAEVSAIEFNQGCWGLGSVVSGEPNIFLDIIKNGSKTIQKLSKRKKFSYLDYKDTSNQSIRPKYIE